MNATWTTYDNHLYGPPTTTIYFVDDELFRRDDSGMGFDKGLQRVAFKEGRSSLAFQSSGFIVAAPSTLAERRLVKRAEWTLMMYADMTEEVQRKLEEVQRKLAAAGLDSSSHRPSIIDDVAEDYGRSARIVETAIATTRATLPSAAAE